MNNVRMKIAAGATVLGLGGLGGFALAGNDAATTTTAAPATATTRPKPKVHTQVIHRTIQVRPRPQATAASGPAAPAAASSPPPGPAPVASAPAVPAPAAPAPAATPVSETAPPPVSTHTSGAANGAGGSHDGERHVDNENEAEAQDD